MKFRAFPWSKARLGGSILPHLHEWTLRLALAAIPIGATIIHPALGTLTALATAALLTHLHNRSVFLKPEA